MSVRRSRKVWKIVKQEKQKKLKILEENMDYQNESIFDGVPCISGMHGLELYER